MTTAWVRRSAQEEGPGGAAQKGLSRKEAPDLHSTQARGFRLQAPRYAAGAGEADQAKEGGRKRETRDRKGR